jgi:hypothetical protein
VLINLIFSKLAEKESQRKIQQSMVRMQRFQQREQRREKNLRILLLNHQPQMLSMIKKWLHQAQMLSMTKK